MSHYVDWGFTNSPFQTTPLPSSVAGRALLTGRDTTLRQLKLLLRNGPKSPTIEGQNGVGKTSLVNVCAFELFQSHLDDPKSPLYVPCQEQFQLDPESSLDDFEFRVYLAIAQTLIFRAKDKDIFEQSAEKAKRSDAVNHWLNSSLIEHISGGVQLLSVGFNSGTAKEPNTGAGFSRSGFQNLVKTWLTEIFNEHSEGGVVCILDNLEILRSSQLARDRVEAIRDRLLDIKGIRWVLCGATGIMLTTASSARLSGLLHEPIELHELDSTHAGDLYDTRIR